jgi:predicted enzyme related to lactoylglutathione lyase
VFTSGKRLILYCAGGGRSALAAQTLQQMGFDNIAHLAGGFGAWKAAGKPVEGGNWGTPQVVEVGATGIGGIFFKANDPEALARWYADHLGVALENPTVSSFEWRERNDPDTFGCTVWSPFKASSTYFDPGRASFMVNFRVRELVRLLQNLRAAGVTVFETIDEYDYGRFAWILDGEGNKVELWEPTGVKPH